MSGWLVLGSLVSKDGRSDISWILLPSPYYPTAGLCPKTPLRGVWSRSSQQSVFGSANATDWATGAGLDYVYFFCKWATRQEFNSELNTRHVSPFFELSFMRIIIFFHPEFTRFVPTSHCSATNVPHDGYRSCHLHCKSSHRRILLYCHRLAVFPVIFFYYVSC